MTRADTGIDSIELLPHKGQVLGRIKLVRHVAHQ